MDTEHLGKLNQQNPAATATDRATCPLPHRALLGVAVVTSVLIETHHYKRLGSGCHSS